MNFEIAPKETEVKLNWDDAQLYCFSLNIDGKTGWRLPTKEEYNAILNSENDFRTDGYYWYSDEDYPKPYRLFVRAIRDLKDD